MMVEQETLTRVNAVIFDLDNVLFDETDYIFAAYREIAVFLSKQCICSELQIYDRLVCDLQKKTSMYPKLFNDVVVSLGLNEELVPDILKIFSSVQVRLKLRSDAKGVLLWLRQQKVKLGLVTNGTVTTQRNKVRILGLERFFDVIVYAREKGKENEKPKPEAYTFVLTELGVVPEEALCVGDNPYTDFWGAKKIGMRTVRLLAGEFRDVRLSVQYEAGIMLRSLQELIGIVEQINDSARSMVNF
jgi:putative hydrolase of the HAD superfamily